MTYTTDIPIKMIEHIMDIVCNNYMKHLHIVVDMNPSIVDSVPSIITNPSMISIHLGRKHIGIEFHGREIGGYSTDRSNLKLEFNDYTKSDYSLLDEIVGFSFGNKGVQLPLPPLSENLKYPTTKGMDKLLDIGWNFAVDNSITVFGETYPSFSEGESYRIINSTFFDCLEDSLITRHIKWMDIFPVEIEDQGDNELFQFSLPYSDKQAEQDIRYEFDLPIGFQLEKLKKINDFVELYSNKDCSETVITRFLAEKDKNFILNSNFGGIEIYPEITCEWQSESRKAIKPDFFIENSNGYSDIVEFKLPILKNSTVVGKNNRETFSSEVNSYISQTRVYAEYFEDPNNRKWLEEKHGIKVYKPKRILVMGSKKDFQIDEWIKIKSDYSHLDILTYDDIKDTAISQLYDKK